MGEVRSVADLEAMCGPMDPEVAEAAASGALAVLGSDGSDPRPLWLADGTTTSELPARGIRCPGWERSVVGVVLTSTATALGYPTSASAEVFAPVTREQAELVRAAFESSGLDVSLLTFGGDRNTLAIPLAAWVALAVTCALSVGGAAATSRAQALVLGRYAGTLTALGLSSSWCRTVLRIQVLLTTVLGVLLAAGAAALPVAIAAVTLPETVIAVPWLLLAVIALMVVLVAALARPARAADQESRSRVAARAPGSARGSRDRRTRSGSPTRSR